MCDSHDRLMDWLDTAGVWVSERQDGVLLLEDGSIELHPSTMEVRWTRPHRDPSDAEKRLLKNITRFSYSAVDIRGSAS
jgi:hypothetical protein